MKKLLLFSLLIYYITIEKHISINVFQLPDCIGDIFGNRRFIGFRIVEYNTSYEKHLNVQTVIVECQIFYHFLFSVGPMY